MIQATMHRAAAPAPASNLDLAALAKQAFQPWSDAYETWRSGVSDLVQQAQAPIQVRSKPGCGCDACRCSQCGSDPCSCRCCVTDADLLLEARVGERRIVPIVIENHWRRERDIELELSSWTKTSAGVVITAEILGETSFKLPPCGEAKVLITVQVAPPPQQGGDNTDTPAANAASATRTNANNANAAAVVVGRRDIPDVDQCAVSYADLRIKGCDIRSVRIAVAVLPRDCDAFHVDCACGCC
jgi:hypothetical protein